MSFNYKKFKLMNFGRNNIENEYTMDLGENLISHKIEKTLAERDFGFLLSLSRPIKPSSLFKLHSPTEK